MPVPYIKNLSSMPKKKKIPKTKVKLQKRKTKADIVGNRHACSLQKKHAPADKPVEFQWRERRLKDIPFVDRHPTPETAKKYNDTLPLPFGGEVKKDAMREHGLIH